MSHNVLAARHLNQRPRVEPEDADYQTFGAEPFAGAQSAVRAVAAVVAKVVAGTVAGTVAATIAGTIAGGRARGVAQKTGAWRHRRRTSVL